MIMIMMIGERAGIASVRVCEGGGGDGVYSLVWMWREAISRT